MPPIFTIKPQYFLLPNVLCQIKSDIYGYSDGLIHIM